MRRQDLKGIVVRRTKAGVPRYRATVWDAATQKASTKTFATAKEAQQWRAANMRRRATVAERFWAKVDVRGPDDCWEWNAGRTVNGYGQFRGKGDGGQNRLAHRASWEINVGPIPAGMLICHHCDNPPCVNPAHLYVGTKSDNSRDMIERERHPRMGPKYIARKKHELAVAALARRV